jgi:hypothetical protein
MLGGAFADALDRIASRAQDLRDAYRPGVTPLHDDVRTGGAAAASTDPLSATAPPGAWFVVRAGDGERAYTRDGVLRIDDGVLRNAEGDEILGYPGGDARGVVPVPLRVPEADRALGRGADAAIESDGTVAYTRTAIDPRTGTRSLERVSLGRVALARFPAGSSPQRVDATHVGAATGVVPHLGTPADGTFPPLAPRSRDAGAVDVQTGLQRLNEAYLAFEALGAAQRARFGVERTTLDLVK